MSFVDKGMRAARILDLNIVLDLCIAIMVRHRMLVRLSGINGPFYLKAHLENVWRTIPFMDLQSM